MILTPKTPGAMFMKIIDHDGTVLTDKYAVLAFDTVTGAMIYCEKTRTVIGNRLIVGERQEGHFPRAKVSYTQKLLT